MTAIVLKPSQLAPELRARVRRTPGELTKAMLRSARRGQALLVRKTPKDQGQAKAGWRVSKPIKGTRGARVDLYNDAPHVGILEEGARPHGVNIEGRMAIYEWVLRNIPAARVSGPVQHRRYKSGGRTAMQAASTEGQAMAITNAIIWKLRTKGQKGKFFVREAMDELQRDFGVQLDKQISDYSKRRAKRGPK